MGRKGEGQLPRENGVRTGQSKREGSFQVEETIHAKALGKNLENLGTKKMPEYLQRRERKENGIA